VAVQGTRTRRKRKGAVVSTEIQKVRGENNAHTITADLSGNTIRREKEVQVMIHDSAPAPLLHYALWHSFIPINLTKRPRVTPSRILNETILRANLDLSQ
jgi:hypothetical protein